MATLACSNCGAPMIEGHRFCRQCGSASQLEAETRELDQRRSFAVTTEPVGHAPTSPAVFTPGAMFGAPVSAPPATIEPQKSRTPLLIAGAFIGLVLMVLMAIGGFIFVRQFDRPAVRQVEIPVIPVPPAPPLPPPTPPPQGVVATEVSDDQAFRYPGSKVLFSSIQPGKTVLSLHTNAPLDTVVKWYESRLDSTKKVSLPESVILSSEKVKVVLASEGSGTTIILTNEKD